ncbi:MAG: o-succinylbenzoate synthase [Salibacteraceae bacterium]
MFKVKITPYSLKFILPSGTSRGILKTKDTYFLTITDIINNKFGIGECALFKGLSIEDNSQYEAQLNNLKVDIESGSDLNTIQTKYANWPSLVFGAETAYKSLISTNPFELFPSAFQKKVKGIEINGLIWMGDIGFMKEQLREKLATGFTCIKLKIGAIDFKSELSLLQEIRTEFDADQVEIRVDANGAFEPQTALKKLRDLTQFQIHSIEQPIKANQRSEMRELCSKTSLPIALDEELIGVFGTSNRIQLLDEIQPQYIILKPALVGGFAACDEWIKLAEERNIGWWITSALESNIGLNAIAQYVATRNTTIPQGLGTGKLFSNNIDSPLEIKQNKLWLNDQKWDLSNFQK